MEEKEIEELILGIDDNPTEAWKTLNENWQGGSLVMPEDEIERRESYRTMLRRIFAENDIIPEKINDPWLRGKVERIMEEGKDEKVK